jgi:hypothetical protein
VDTVLEIALIYDKITSRDTRRTLARAIIFGARIHKEVEIGAAFPIPLRVAKSVIADLIAEEYSIDSKLTLMISQISEQHGSFSLLDEMGRHGHVVQSEALDKTTVMLLCKIFTQHSEYAGILNLLSNHAKVEDIRTCGHMIDRTLFAPELYEDGKLREAALSVRLAQVDWQDEDLDVLVEYLTHPDASTEAIVTTITQRTQNGAVPEPVAAKFLLLLRDDLLTRDRMRLSEVIVSLNDYLRRRMSNLPSPEIWSKLQLPQGLLGLMTKKN